LAHAAFPGGQHGCSPHLHLRARRELCGAGAYAAEPAHFDHQIGKNADRMVAQGRQTFRFDTFGEEAFWGDTL